MRKVICLFCVCSIVLASSVTAFAENLDISAKSAVLMEASTGKILYEKNPDERLPIASVTKVMTMLLIMEALDSGRIQMDEIVTASERAKSMGGSTMFLEAGEQLKVYDMLKGIAVASANDGCVAMAEHIAGSEAAFVNMMNQRAKELGMVNTNFENSNGLDDDNHYSSAKDVAIMSRELIKHEKIFEFTTIWMDTLRNGKFQLANTNKLIRFYKGANGLKTGSTSKALCCLSATAKRDNMQLIAVVLAAPTSKDRFASASALLDYGFANYAVKPQVQQNDVLGSVNVSKGSKASIDAVAKQDFSVLIEKGTQQSEIKKDIQLSDNINAPIEKGTVIGKVEFSLNGENLGCVDAVAAENVSKKGFGGMISDIFRKWLNI
ncbi:MAG: D-alanyl-D-alanine carboxypeptidase [Clostridia bacterium]|nr:D-alanyl-D-alanine carboxypeptidase [Clostridia bacterium]